MSDGESLPLLSSQNSKGSVAEKRHTREWNDAYSKGVTAVQMNSGDSLTLHGATTSNEATIMHLMKAHIGTGILALPCAFSQSGTLTGVLGLVVLCGVCTHAMHILVKCSSYLCTQTGSSYLDYSAVSEEAFKTCSSRSARHASKARNVVNVFLMLTQFGFCCSYILFISQNVQFVVMKLMDNVGEDCDPDRPMKLQLYELCVTVLLILLVFIRNIKYLAPFSALANLAAVAGLAVILCDILLHEGLKDVSRLPLFNGWDKLPLYFGTVIFCFGGIPVILPLRNKMKEPDAFTQYFGVINLSMALVCILNITMGFYGYLAFGDKAAGSITLNLTSWYGVVMQLLYSFVVFISYAVQFYVPMDLLGSTVANARLSQYIGSRNFDYLVRTALVLMTFVLVAVIDRYLDLFISLVGASTASALALIFPPLLEIMTFWPMRTEMKGYWMMLVKDCLLVMFGLLGLVVGSAVALQQLIKGLTTPDRSGACPPAL